MSIVLGSILKGFISLVYIIYFLIPHLDVMKLFHIGFFASCIMSPCFQNLSNQFLNDITEVTSITFAGRIVLLVHDTTLEGGLLFYFSHGPLYKVN